MSKSSLTSNSAKCLMQEIVAFASPRTGEVHLTHDTKSALPADVTEHLEVGKVLLATFNLDHIVKLR